MKKNTIRDPNSFLCVCVCVGRGEGEGDLAHLREVRLVLQHEQLAVGVEVVVEVLDARLGGWERGPEPLEEEAVPHLDRHVDEVAAHAPRPGVEPGIQYGSGTRSPPLSAVSWIVVCTSIIRFMSHAIFGLYAPNLCWCSSTSM